MRRFTGSSRRLPRRADRALQMLSLSLILRPTTCTLSQTHTVAITLADLNISIKSKWRNDKDSSAATAASVSAITGWFYAKFNRRQPVQRVYRHCWNQWLPYGAAITLVCLEACPGVLREFLTLGVLLKNIPALYMTFILTISFGVLMKRRRMCMWKPQSDKIACVKRIVQPKHVTFQPFTTLMKTMKAAVAFSNSHNNTWDLRRGRANGSSKEASPYLPCCF